MPEIENLFSVKKAKRNNDAEAILLGVSRRWLREMLKAYLRSGRNKFSLIDHRKGNYRKKYPIQKTTRIQRMTLTKSSNTVLRCS